MAKRWRKIRKIGKKRFIILFALLFGLSMAIFSSVVKMIIDNHSDLSLFFSSAFFGMLTGGTLGGFLISFSLWELNENRHKKQNEE